MSNRIYLGCKGNAREIFRSPQTPTGESHGKRFTYVIGPFRTVRGARWMADPVKGRTNPHCQTVSDAERLAKQYGI